MDLSIIDTIYIIPYKKLDNSQLYMYGYSNNIINTVKMLVNYDKNKNNLILKSLFVIKRINQKIIQNIINNLAHNINMMYIDKIDCYITNLKYTKLRNLIIRNLFQKKIYTYKNYDEYKNLSNKDLSINFRSKILSKLNNNKLNNEDTLSNMSVCLNMLDSKKIDDNISNCSIPTYIEDDIKCKIYPKIPEEPI